MDENETLDGDTTENHGLTDLSVRFAVERSSTDYWTEGDWDIPKKYDQIWVRGRVSSNSKPYQHLLNLLRRDDRKFKDIIFNEEQCYGSSFREFLTIVTACVGKVDTLYFKGHTNDLALVRCLCAGLSTKNGIKGIHLTCTESFTLDQMKMFARGLSFARNLEHLSLSWDGDEDNADALLHTEALIQGLKENKLLRGLKLKSWLFPGDTLLRLILTLHSCSSLRKVDLEMVDISSPFVHGALRAWLAQEDCKLESFEVNQICFDYTSRECIDLFNLARPNTSLKELLLGGIDIGSHSLGGILSNYKNLISLDLRWNMIADLEPFESFLLAKNSILESLMLSGNPISVDSIRSFAQKLPQMKVLRNLELSISNDDCGAVRVLANAAVQNTSLERFHVISDKCDPYGYGPLAERVLGHVNEPALLVEAFLLSKLESDLVNKLNHTLCLNRAGRQQIGCNPSSLPLNLLPIAVSRASNLRYYKVDGNERKDEWGYYPSSRSGGLDAAFWLLRENSTFLAQIFYKM